jgi:hypothetical protein
MPKKRTINNDPDFGLEIREEVIQKLKAQKEANKPRITLEQVAKQHNIRLNGERDSRAFRPSVE